MARSDKRYSVYPRERTTDVVGTSAPELNGALDHYAVLTRLMRCGRAEVVEAAWRMIDEMLKSVGE